MGSEKFCLRWNDFEGNISSAFRELKDDKDFFDVTLACEEEQIQAHRVILSACSPFFHQILRRNPHQHPLLYLKGVTFTDLQSVLNFMYHGEVSVAQEELNSFLAVAEDLKVKGLTQTQPGTQTRKQENPSSRSKEREPMPQKLKRPINSLPLNPRTTSQLTNNQQIANTHVDDIQEIVQHQQIKSEPRDTSLLYSSDQTHVPVPAQADNHIIDTYQEEEAGYEDYSHYQEDQQMTVENRGEQSNQYEKEVDVRTPEDLLKFVLPGETGFVCSYCAKVFPNKRDVRNHLESIHFPNYFTYSCEQCGKEFKSLNSRNIHITRNHNKPKKIAALY
eukprot:GFUD01034263.1.p1 GENE.GFUD01034263.1~~GFUD01034263.1.p1  ORF type:complete len:333 (+),score=58.08 GFUD01034263.1:57-1055(+)